ncbi:alginate export family protein [Sphingomonas sp. So64.6b]|uniref:alginate export family protein n=1 Tax=Sphingomonas sp. So64.6b TaxID=2997354 RepID=UPI00160237AE|nr:alginate export family protein [Sphingomonas sp. So64.6b]QNA82967.1 alginate export family protein [Sphingomonas sp. So64.6b]
MRTAILPMLVAGLVSTPALADPLVLKPIVDARLRYEHVDQAPLPSDADAVTARIRAGFEAISGDFTLLAESEAVLAINPAYNSGLNGKTRYPIVPDPQNVELNRLQLQYRGLPATIVTVGRQRINLDDQRFVGSVGWRDNEQTFDAARVEWSGIKNLKADVTYAWDTRTIWGIDGGNRFGLARYQGIGGDNIFATLAYKARLGTLTGFAYLIDQDRPLVLGNSSQTYGARFAGALPLSKTIKLNYVASYARQSDYARNPNRYAASYYAADVALDVKAFKVGGGYEVLGADNGLTLTSFQTPLATLHKFNGWADKFLVTPPNGLRDAYGSVGYGWKKQGPFDAIALTAAYHRFDSDRLGQHYGDEIDVQASLKRGRYTALVKYADYDADRFATDTSKLWLSLEWAI